MNNLLGVSQFFMNHAFYDAKLLEKAIRYFYWCGVGVCVLTVGTLEYRTHQDRPFRPL